MAEYLHTYYLLRVEDGGKVYHYGRNDMLVAMISKDVTEQVKNYGYVSKKEARAARIRIEKLYSNVSIVEAVVAYEDYNAFVTDRGNRFADIAEVRNEIVANGDCFRIMKIK